MREMLQKCVLNENGCEAGGFRPDSDDGEVSWYVAGVNGVALIKDW